MALSFTGGDSDVVNHGSDSTLDTLSSATILWWVYLDDVNNALRYFGCKTDDQTTGWHSNKSGGAGSRLVCRVNGSITDAFIESVDGTLKAAQWQYIVWQWDWTFSHQAFWGDLTTVVSQMSYISLTVGVGTQDNDSSFNLTLGNISSGNNSINGDVAFFAVYNSYFTTQQIQAHQYEIHRPLYSNCVLFCNYGWNGTSTQPDWSGNLNNGTVTGATVADHVPLGFTTPTSPLDLSAIGRRGHVPLSRPSPV